VPAAPLFKLEEKVKASGPKKPPFRAIHESSPFRFSQDIFVSSPSRLSSNSSP
jgi:hypothetical protein